MDRLQPLLHNFFTDGGTWSAGGITAKSVERRMQPIGTASDTLGDISAQLIALAVEQGILAPAQQEA